MTAHPQPILAGEDGEVFYLGEILPPPEAELYDWAPSAWDIEDRKGEAVVRATAFGAIGILYLFILGMLLFHFLASSPPVRAPVASTVAAPAAEPVPLTGAFEAAPVSNRESR